MLRHELSDALKAAQKEKDQLAVNTIRLILAALKDRDIAARSKGNQDGISDDELLQMLQSMIKQRNESIQQYEKAGRDDLVKQEEDEIKVIERFLPEQMSEGEIESAAKDAISEADAQSLKDMGKVMGLLKEKYAGQMDFSKASQVVKSQLS